MSTDMDAARRRVVDREANALRDAAGMDALPPALEEALERAIRTVAEANGLTEEFDVGVRFKPTLVDAQRAALRIRAPATDDDVDHELEVAIDVTWDDTGRKSNWPTATLEARVEEWREVYGHWVEGELFTSEAADAISSSAAAEASSEMRKLGTAELRTEPLAYFLDTETAYPAIVGPDGERRGTPRCPRCRARRTARPSENPPPWTTRETRSESRFIFSCASNARRGYPAPPSGPRRSRSDRRRDPATDHGRGHGDPSRAIPRSPRAGMGNRARDAPRARRRRPRVQGLGEISRLSRRRRRRHRGRRRRRAATSARTRVLP